MADAETTTTVLTAEVVRYDDPVIITERVAVSAFIAAYTDPTRWPAWLSRCTSPSWRRATSSIADPAVRKVGGDTAHYHDHDVNDG